MAKTPKPPIPLTVHVVKRNAHMRRVPGVHGAEAVKGTFLFVLEITAPVQAVYIPLSAASGKKPAGFVYQIEGTAEGAISTTDVSSKGEGVTQVTSGTLLYGKIPAGKTATVRVVIEMRGRVGKEYSIIIDHINYKGDPNDARYQKYETPLVSEVGKLK